MAKTKRLTRHPKPDDKEQSQRFIDSARKVEADEEHSAADELLGRLAKKPPQPRPKNQKSPAR